MKNKQLPPAITIPLIVIAMSSRPARGQELAIDMQDTVIAGANLADCRKLLNNLDFNDKNLKAAIRDSSTAAVILQRSGEGEMARYLVRINLSQSIKADRDFQVSKADFDLMIKGLRPLHVAPSDHPAPPNPQEVDDRVITASNLAVFRRYFTGGGGVLADSELKSAILDPATSVVLIRSSPEPIILINLRSSTRFDRRLRVTMPDLQKLVKAADQVR
jgi:hypothetical protein